MYPKGIKYVGQFNESGLAKVGLDNGKFAFMNINGELQEGRYNNAYSYKEGFATVELEDGKAALIDKDGNYCFSEEEWMDYIKKHPEAYSKLPPHRFEDRDFIGKINNILREHYKSAVDKGEITVSDVNRALSAIEDKNNIATQELQRRREELDAYLQKIKEQEEMKRTTKQTINKFFSENFIDDVENN